MWLLTVVLIIFKHFSAATRFSSYHELLFPTWKFVWNGRGYVDKRFCLRTPKETNFISLNNNMCYRRNVSRLIIYPLMLSNLDDLLPACTCQDPGQVPNAERIPVSGPYNCGSQLTYTCNAGYQMQGNGQRFCSPPGQWTGSQPTCVPIQGIHKTNTSGYFYRANERNNTLPNNRICIYISTKLNMSHFSYSCKTKRENGISRLNSALCVNCKFTSEHNSRIFQNYLLLNHLDVHLVQTTSETSKNKKSDHSVFI